MGDADGLSDAGSARRPGYFAPIWIFTFQTDHLKPRCGAVQIELVTGNIFSKTKTHHRVPRACAKTHGIIADT